MHRVFVNGEEGGGIAPDDPGLLLGMTVFETMRTYHGKPFRLGRHLDRLVASADSMDIPIASKASLENAVLEKLAHCRPATEVKIRLTVTAGGSQIIDLQSLDVDRVGRGLAVGKLEWNPPSYLPGIIKHGSRASWVVASREQGVPEVLLVDSSGHILEASRSNVFVVRDGVLLTPRNDQRFLQGVTRGALIEAAGRTGLALKETDVLFGESYDEFYLSSTLKQLAPVVSIAGQPGPAGGPVGEALRKAFQDLVDSETRSG